MGRRQVMLNSMEAKREIIINSQKYVFFSLKKAAAELGIELSRLPFSIKILFENLLRFEDGISVKYSDIQAIKRWLEEEKLEHEVAFYPARVLMQDFTGVPALVDLAAMRDAISALKGSPERVNPIIPVDLVIDHSVQVDKYGTEKSFEENVQYEMQRNIERYEFLSWGQKAFNNFRVVPPGTGICHQVNLEYLAKVVWTDKINGSLCIYPDTLVGTDSHTTMVNGMSVLGWGVGGIEAEAAMLGQPLSMLIPKVVGVKLTGRLKLGINATDLALTVTQMLRAHNVVGKFVEFYGDGLQYLSLADRATIANMAPEYGATCGIFPIDDETVKYLHLTGRSAQTIDLIITYAKEQGLWRDSNSQMQFNEYLELDLDEIETSLAGPRRPQDRLVLSEVATNFENLFIESNAKTNSFDLDNDIENYRYKLSNGSVVIAAITSCTNTSNPFVMLGAALFARNALRKGLSVKPWVKTSLAPGSQAVTAYLSASGLDKYLNELGFNLVGYGCTTCIGNSGALLPAIEKDILDNNLIVAAVLSGNRNFAGRIHPLVQASYLASPILCIAYAISGTMRINLATDPIGMDKQGSSVYLRDIWPSNEDINTVMNSVVTSRIFEQKYSNVFNGTPEWQGIKSIGTATYNWDVHSTYIKKPSYFDTNAIDNAGAKNIVDARIIAIFGDSITTDHISPAGSIAKNSPAARYLESHGVNAQDFNSYGARRGNHEVMMRGTFANIRIRNRLTDGIEGGYTKFYKNSNEIMTIYDAAMLYKRDNVDLVIIAGKEYGTGSSRDWAAKGTKLLGIKSVIAESFERIHRSNLVGMGVLPLVFDNGITANDLILKGSESISILDILNLTPKKQLRCVIADEGRILYEIPLICRVDTEIELMYIKAGGILPYVLNGLAASR